MRVLVDVGRGRVMLGGVELTGQWVDFYAMLAVTRTSERGAEELVPAEAVARIGPWRHKAKGLLHTIESTYDQAFFFETRARIEMEMPTGDSEPASDLDKAEKLYLDAGDAASSKRVRDMASSIRASGRCATDCRRPRSRRRSR
jgi:hypothetical protein